AGRPHEVAARLIGGEGGLVDERDAGPAAREYQGGDAARRARPHHNRVETSSDHRASTIATATAPVAQTKNRSARSIGASRSARPNSRCRPSLKVSWTDTLLTRRRSIRAGVLSARWPIERKNAAAAVAAAASDSVQCCA